MESRTQNSLDSPDKATPEQGSQGRPSFGGGLLAVFIGGGLVSAIVFFVASAILSINASWMVNPYFLFFYLLALIVVAAVSSNSTVASYSEKEMASLRTSMARNLEEVNASTKKKLNEMDEERNLAKKEASIWKASLKEKSKGYPTLISAIQEYESLVDQGLASYFLTKPHPAVRAAETIKEQSRLRREAERENKVTQSIINYYEDIAPFLVDLKDDVYEDDKTRFLEDYTEEEKQDPVIKFLTKEEYRSLSTAERNQMALDRYWERPKSKRHVGRIYERYVGYLFERDGFDVDYQGIFKGFEDLGRDLICAKENRVVIVQCKYWSQFKTIYEKHIFQFFGTVFQYKDQNPSRSVKGCFYTTTEVSALARRFASELGIVLREKLPFDQTYPCIKCNINASTKERIYHLPFDQQYDRTKISNTGEKYVSTVAEAEASGFRRAFRWRGINQQT